MPLADQPLERDRARRDCTPGRFGTSEVPNLTRIRRVRLTQTTRGRFGPRVVLNLPVVADLRCRHANKTCPDGQTVCAAPDRPFELENRNQERTNRPGARRIVRTSTCTPSLPGRLRNGLTVLGHAATYDLQLAAYFGGRPLRLALGVAGESRLCARRVTRRVQQMVICREKMAGCGQSSGRSCVSRNSVGHGGVSLCKLTYRGH